MQATSLYLFGRSEGPTHVLRGPSHALRGAAADHCLFGTITGALGSSFSSERASGPFMHSRRPITHSEAVGNQAPSLAFGAPQLPKGASWVQEPSQIGLPPLENTFRRHCFRDPCIYVCSRFQNMSYNIIHVIFNSNVPQDRSVEYRTDAPIKTFFLLKYCIENVVMRIPSVSVNKHYQRQVRQLGMLMECGATNQSA